MSQTEIDGAAADVERLLDGAAKTIAHARSCWLATLPEGQDFGIRPMGRLPRDVGDGDWTVKFLTDGRSRKAAQIRRGATVAAMFQHEAEDAYVKVSGKARLIEDASQVFPRWRKSYDIYFPTEEDRANASFIVIDVEHMDLWIRGVTPEPFGLFPTVLDRTAAAGWRLASGG